MELKHDWKSLNEILFPDELKKGLGASGSANAGLTTGVLIEDKGSVQDGMISSGASFKDRGASTIAESDLTSKYNLDRTMVLNSAELERAISDSAALGANYYQQIALLRDRLTNNQKNPLIISKHHFIVDLFNGKLKRFLPNRFNVLIFIDHRSSLAQNAFSTELRSIAAAPANYKAILLSFVEGKLDQFFEPDFTSLSNERLVDWVQDSELIGQYLENRYLSPCFGLFVYRDVWERMLEAANTGSANPWRLFVRYFDDERGEIFPKNFLTKTLLFTQRLMVYIGRV